MKQLIETRKNDNDVEYIINFDKNGDCISSVEKSNGALWPMTYNTLYNKIGKKLETIQFFATNAKKKLGLSLYSKAFKKDSLKQALEIYKYDINNKIISGIFKSGNKCDTTHYKYNSELDLVEYDDFNSIFPEITYYKHDNHHHLLESDCFGNNLFIERLTYKYLSFDAKNNWTKAIASSSAQYNGAPVSTTITRKISYY